MNEPRAPWHPSREELERILDELRPIVAEFARKAASPGWRAGSSGAAGGLLGVGMRIESGLAR